MTTMDTPYDDRPEKPYVDRTEKIWQDSFVRRHARAERPDPLQEALSAPSPLNRVGILERASNLITGDRASAYGDFGEQMRSLSRAFNGITGKDLSPQDVATLLMLLKIRRMQSATDQDSETDLCGYAALYGEYFK